MKTKFDLAHRGGFPNSTIGSMLAWVRGKDVYREQFAFIEQRVHEYSVEEHSHPRWGELVVAVLYVSFPEDVAMEWIMRFE